MIISVRNNLDSYSQYSFTSTNTTSGGTAFPVKNINSFTASHAIQIGKTGEEQAEVLMLSSGVSGTVLNTTGTARFNHNIDTPIYDINYDQIVIKRSTSGTTGSATAFATISVTPDSQYTTYNDTTGASTYAYKTRFHNSITGEETSDSDWFVPGGPDFYQLQRLRQRIKDALFSANFLKSDNVIDDWINEWVEQMTNKALKVNKAYSLGTAAYSFGTAGLGTVTEPLFKYASKIEITWDGVTYSRSAEIPLNDFSSTDIYTQIYPRHYWQGDTVFGVLPTGQAGTVRMALGQLQTRLINDGDNLPQFLRGYTTGCVDYALFRAYENDQKPDLADRAQGRFTRAMNDFTSEITPRDQTGVKTISLTDTLSGRDDDFDLEYFAI